jgi:uncharacterized protein HemX
MDKKKGFVNDAVVVAVGLAAIVFITAWVVNANTEYYKQAQYAADATSEALMQQRDIAIKKLMRLADARQIELASAKKNVEIAKAELDASKKKIENIKAIVQ